MERLNQPAQPNELTQKPFKPTRGFDTSWWAMGYERGPVVWSAVIDAELGEVARAQIRLGSHVSAAYPTARTPAWGGTEIERVEVRTDLQRTGLHLGRRTLDFITQEFPGPVFAFSRDADSDGFWEKVWDGHPHAEATARANGRSRFAQLFVFPG
jgi:hypothetical protein